MGGDGLNKFLWSAMLAAGGAAGGYYLAEKLLPPDREKLDSTAFRALNDAETGQELTWGEEGKGAWGTLSPYVILQAKTVGAAAPISQQ